MVCVGRQRTRGVNNNSHQPRPNTVRILVGHRDKVFPPPSLLCFHGPSAGRVTLHRSPATLVADERIALFGSNYRNKDPSAPFTALLSLGKAGAGTRILDRQLAAAPSFWGADAFSSAYKYHCCISILARSLSRGKEDLPVWRGPLPVTTSRLSALSASQTSTTRLEMPHILKSKLNLKKTRPGQETPQSNNT